ncbi:MAG: phosphatidylserine decarboxylase [Gammaproteobacteria bacterium]
MIPIAREVRVLLIAIGVTLAFAHYHYGSSIVWPAWSVYMILLFVFRDFSRVVPSQPTAIVSPVDGKISKITEAYNPYLQGVAQCIHVKQHALGEYNVHSPLEGKVKNIWVISPNDAEVSQLAMWINTDEGDDVVIAVNLQSIFRHAACAISVGERLGQGQRCGFMAFSCEIVLYIPTSAHITVKTGQSVRAGSDKLAELVYESNN